MRRAALVLLPLVLTASCGGCGDDGDGAMEAGQTDEYTMLNWMSIEPK